MSGYTGYGRPDGRLGARNRLLVIPGVVCSAHVAQRVAEMLGPDAVALPHQHGCSQAAYDVAATAAALEGLGCSPNVGAALVVSLGCEGIDGAALAERIGSKSGKPVAHLHIQQMGGSPATIAAGVARGKELMPPVRRAPIGLRDLVVGVRVAQPDETTPACEAAIEAACRLLLAAGGTVIRTYAGAGGGSVSRSGTSSGPTAAAATLAPATQTTAPNLGYGVRPGEPGCYVMEAPAAHEAEALTGLAAAGANVILYGTGKGTPIGHPVVPVVKVTASQAAVDAWGDHIDLDLRQACSDPAGAILDTLLAVAGGRETAAELLGHDEFAILRIGLTL